MLHDRAIKSNGSCQAALPELSRRDDTDSDSDSDSDNDSDSDYDSDDDCCGKSRSRIPRKSARRSSPVVNPSMVGELGEMYKSTIDPDIERHDSKMVSRWVIFLVHEEALLSSESPHRL